jgi:glutathione peroxidase
MLRRLAGSLLAVVALLPSQAVARPAPAGDHVKAPELYDFTVQTIDGEARSLADYRGHTLLVVNTASRCGFTPQYESLEALYQQYKARGFVVLAFPANDFLWQEPGSNAEIKRFCAERFHTSFPLFAKISVKGKRIAPLYAWLTQDSAFPGKIPWNFTKFLFAPDGRLVARYSPKTDPRSREVTEQVEKLLPPTE